MKKAKFQGHIKNIELTEIEDALRSIPEFSDLKSWKMKRLEVGEMHHTYVFSKGAKKYFIKEVKPHEAQANYFLYALKLPHLPYTAYPQLLENKVLVIPYIEGGMMPEKERKLDYGLLRDFITFQNKMNDKKFFRKYNPPELENLKKRDDNWFTGRFEVNLKEGRKNLLMVKRKYPLSIVDRYLEIYDLLRKDEHGISKDYAGMPFTRMHHDFKENNILGKKHKLIDWGSSYGRGPFMFDLSIFLVHDKKAMDIFMKESNIARQASREQVERWLYVALANRFNDFCKWYIRPGSVHLKSEAKLKNILNHNYKTYRYLIE